MFALGNFLVFPVALGIFASSGRQVCFTPETVPLDAGKASQAYTPDLSPVMPQQPLGLEVRSVESVTDQS
jgi:hypothetical protein